MPPQMGKQFGDADMDSAPVEHEDTGKWELDTDPWLNRIYHDLLGESLDENGVYQRDKLKNRAMNELGASDFINEVQGRVSLHMQFSELSNDEITDIASRSAEIYANKIEDFWPEWEIDPSRSNLEGVSQRMFDILRITLKIAMNGGMKTHREHVKSPRMIVQPQQEQPGGVL